MPSSTAKTYDMTVYPTAGLVRSARDGARAYQVTLPSCECPDFINRKGWVITVDGVPAVTICKHIAEFMERVGGWNRPSPAEETFPDLTRIDVLSFLRGPRVGMTPRESNAVLAQFGSSEFAEFEALHGITGVVRYDRAAGRYTMTVTFA
jgi:hypothetical protein